MSDCESSGIGGMVLPDLPVEESKPLLKICEGYETDLIFIIAPTTTAKRMAKILDAAAGFIYVVSLLGVTGTRDTVSDTIQPLIKSIREQEVSVGKEVPLAVGFGISQPEHVRTVCAFADGAIVGSAFIKLIEEELDSRNKMLQRIENFTRSLKAGTKIA